jgi:hypothetical protein
LDSLTAWAAGLYEGEGSVYGHKDGARLSLSMTDREPVERFALYLGAKVDGPYTREDYKPVWRVVIGSRRRIRAAFEAFRPWLSPRRIGQFEAALGAIQVQRVMQGEAWSKDCAFAKPLSQAGYKRHRAKGEQPCNPCLESYATYTRALYRKGKTK